MRTTHFSLEGFNDSAALSSEEHRQRYALGTYTGRGGPFTRYNPATSGQCRQQKVQYSSLTV